MFLGPVSFLSVQSVMLGYHYILLSYTTGFSIMLLILNHSLEMKAPF